VVSANQVVDTQSLPQYFEAMKDWDWKAIAAFIGIAVNLGWNYFNSRKTTKIQNTMKRNEIKLRQFDRLINDPVNEHLRGYEKLNEDINAAFLASGDDRCKRLKELVRNDFNGLRQRLEIVLNTADQSNLTSRSDFFGIASDHHDTIAIGFNAMCNDALDENSIKQGKDKTQKGISDLRVTLVNIFTEEAERIATSKK
jgi:hypothetical protein